MDSDLRDKGNRWFSGEVNESHLTPAARSLLETYSAIPSGEVLDHVVKIRDKAWEIFPYPCIGQLRFLDLSLRQRDNYREIVESIQQGKKFLDMACCFGQEIRQLIVDGAPPENIYGCDLKPEFISLGYDLFRDKETLPTKFVTADIFDATSSLTELKGTFDIVYVGSFFHLWGYEDQVKVSTAVASLLRPQKGSVILGRQIGATEAAELRHPTNSTQVMYRHNVDSFRKQWKEIGDNTGVSYKVDGFLEILEARLNFLPADSRRIQFTITRE